MRRNPITCVVALNWPEACFRANAADIAVLRRLLPKGSCVVWAKDEEALLKNLPRATHVLTWHFKREWFALALNLKVVATPAAGRELVSTDAPMGVTVHFGHFHGSIMAESVAAFVLAYARGFFAVEREAPEECRDWSRVWLSDKCRDVAGSKAVVIGYGNVGRAIGEKLSALGVEVFGYSRHLKIPQAKLNARLKKADWIILALPSDTGTDNWLNAARIAKLPRCCAVINVGRGNAIDEKALFAALKKGRLAAAYLDVRRSEPNKCFRYAALPPTPNLKNLFLMPHASAFSEHYMQIFIKELQDDGLL